MREIRTSGLMSGEGKRVVKTIPRPSSTLLVNYSVIRPPKWSVGERPVAEHADPGVNPGPVHSSLTLRCQKYLPQSHREHRDWWTTIKTAF
jgi:hypothetical protein